VNDWDWLRKDIKNRQRRVGCLVVPLGALVVLVVGLLA